MHGSVSAPTHAQSSIHRCFHLFCLIGPLCGRGRTAALLLVASNSSGSDCGTFKNRAASHKRRNLTHFLLSDLKRAHTLRLKLKVYRSLSTPGWAQGFSAVCNLRSISKGIITWPKIWKRINIYWAHFFISKTNVSCVNWAPLDVENKWLYRCLCSPLWSHWFRADTVKTENS